MAISNPQEAKKVALITGITGQDGSYLVELLLEKDYEVRFALLLYFKIGKYHHSGGKEKFYF